MSAVEIAEGFNKRIIEVIQEDFPEFHIAAKEDVWHQRLIGYLMFWMWRWPKDEETGKRKWSSLFMTNFTTTIGYGMFVSSINILTHRRYWWTIAHEYIHIWDMRRLSSVPYSLFYLFPQFLPLFALFAIGAFWVPSMKWFLVFLVFGLPWPSPGRMYLEWRGYTMSLACRYWDTGKISHDDLSYYIDHFTGADYYFMWPFRGHIAAKFQDSLHLITSGEILNDEIFRKVHDAYRNFEGST